MPVQKILGKSDDSLQPARVVTDFSDAYLHQSIQDLLDTLAEIQKTEGVGVGLAANQIEYPYKPVSETDPTPAPGFYPRYFRPLNLYVVSILPERAALQRCDFVSPSVFINATFRKIGEEKAEINESCLSVCGFQGEKVPRYKNIIVTAFDQSGKQFKTAVSDFIARVHQHEIDHGRGAEYLNQLNFSYKEMNKILAWTEDYRNNPAEIRKIVIPEKLVLSSEKPDLAALEKWVFDTMHNLGRHTFFQAINHNLSVDPSEDDSPKPPISLPSPGITK